MKAAVLTISDSCYREEREDVSGGALRRILVRSGWTIAKSRILPDEVPLIQKAVLDLVDTAEIDLLITTGGTGLGPRDVTPEAITPLLDKKVPGLAELMRVKGMEKTPFAALSRSVAGLRNETIILSLPGSPKGARESLEAVLQLLPHAVDLAHGRTRH